MGKSIIHRKEKGGMVIESTKPEVTSFEGEAPPKPIARAEARDSLLGEHLEVEGVEDGTYFKVLEDSLDPTPAGWVISKATGKRIPLTTHIPTGSRESYRKVFLTLKSGERVPVWEKIPQAG